MPELPEVQIIVNDLNAANIAGRSIVGAKVYWSRTIAEPSASAFCRRIKGKKISAIRRRGKFIVFNFSKKDHLLLHLRMSGRLHLVPCDMPRKKHEHVILILSDRRQLRFHDTRKFGRFYLTADAEKILGRLGPEPLSTDFTQKKFAQRLNPRKRLLKPLLLDRLLSRVWGTYTSTRPCGNLKFTPAELRPLLQRQRYEHFIWRFLGC